MEKMESQSCNSLRKPIRRRSHTRKIAQGSVINMAEARREIAHALHLHRSSSNSFSSSSTSRKTQSYDVAQERLAWNMLGNPFNCSTTQNATSYNCCCYSLVEAMPMPLPEPVWSTTAPTVAAAPAGLEAMEFFEWGENQASSYTWWLGFLRALDAGNSSMEKTKQYSNFVKENSRVLMEQQDISSKLGEPTDKNASLDEWLMFPTAQDDS
ncbi:hypothetical protein REPUB_Repub06bG0220100 [Reevesia pubescens]